MHVRYEFTTALPPDRVIAALTDFSERRPEIWPNLDPAQYEVHEVLATSALVTEGSRTPRLWARERYDWSTPGRVSWRAEHSNFCAPGSGVVAAVSPHPDGGSHVTIDWDRRLTSVTGYLTALIVRVGKDRVVGLQKALDRLAEREARREPLRRAA